MRPQGTAAHSRPPLSASSWPKETQGHLISNRWAGGPWNWPAYILLPRLPSHENPQPWDSPAQSTTPPNPGTISHSSERDLGSRFHLKLTMILAANRSNQNVAPQPEIVQPWCIIKNLKQKKKKVTPSISTTLDPSGSAVSSIFQWQSFPALAPFWICPTVRALRSSGGGLKSWRLRLGGNLPLFHFLRSHFASLQVSV